MDRRTFCKAAVAGGSAIMLPHIWVPDAMAQARGQVKEQLKEAQFGTFRESNMDKLLARASRAKDIPTGASGNTIRTADKKMSEEFPDADFSYVYGRSTTAIFYRYWTDGTNACAAWFHSDRVVTMMEGPILVSLYGCMLDMTKYSVDKYISVFNARELTRGFCAPIKAKKRFMGTFSSVNLDPDIFETEFTRIEIKYSRLSSSTSYGESVYKVIDLKEETIVFEGNRKFRLLS